MSDPKSEANYVFHVWINKRQDERGKAGQEWEHDLYEFRSMVQFLEYGHTQIERAFTGNLPLLHRQCSHSPVEKLASNKLLCAMAVNVLECPILASLKRTFDEERGRECGVLGKFYADIPDEQVYRKMAQVCAWHMYTEQVRGKWIDTSKGYLTDDTDRIFWQRVCESMATSDPDRDMEEISE